MPEWSFPGRSRVQRQLQQATKALSAAERALQALPLRGRQADLSARLEERREEAGGPCLRRAYGAYTETEAVFSVDRLLELSPRLPATTSGLLLRPRRDRLAVTSATTSTCRPWWLMPGSAWPRPGHGAGGRRVDGRPRGRGRRAVLVAGAPAGRVRPGKHPHRVERRRFLCLAGDPSSRRPRPGSVVLRTLREAPRLLALDRTDRGDFLRYFYRRYEGAPVDRLRGDSWELFSDLVLTKSFPAGIRRVREHRRSGTRLCSSPVPSTSSSSRCGPSSTRWSAPGSGRRAAVSPASSSSPTDRGGQGPDHGRLRQAHGLDLQQSVAYADSASDLPMLEAAVIRSPSTPKPMEAIARKRGWHVEHWPKAAGGASGRCCPSGARGAS